MKAIDIIMIPVSDQQKAKEFYKKLGFKILVEAPMEHGKTWIQLSLPDDSATIALVTFHGIIFETEDIAKEIKRIQAEGIEVGKVDTMPWGKFAWLKDPDGNQLCLRQK